MSFFKSDIVRGDIQEMMELQQFCFRSAMNFILLDKDNKIHKFLLKDKRKVNNQLLNSLNLLENVVID